MDQFPILKLLAVIGVTYSGLAIALYTGVYLQLKYSYYRPLRQRESQIRAAVINYWERKYGGLRSVLENVLVEHLRVIGRRDDVEDQRFTRTIIVFYTVTGILLFGTTAITCATKEFLIFYASSLTALFSLIFLTQVLFLAMVLFANYYEFNYYKTLEDLERLVSIDAEKGATSAPLVNTPSRAILENT